MTNPQMVPPPQAPAPVAAAPSPEEMISPEQHLLGVVRNYMNLVRTEATYTMFNDMLHEKGAPPLLQFPTGKLGIDGEQIVLEVDLAMPFKKVQDPGQRQQLLQTVWRSHNNYYAQEYTAVLTALALSCTNALAALSRTDAPASNALSFDEIVGRIHALMPVYYKKWAVLKQIEDGIATGQSAVSLGGAVDLDLSQILAAAGVSPEQQQAVLAQTLSAKVGELRQELVPCLTELTTATVRARDLAAASQAG